MRFTKCNICGREFNDMDKQEGFGFDYHVGYGSVHDGEHLQADLCCDCFDKLIEVFIPKCTISPIVKDRW